jgi:hypothetical protein
VKQNVLEMVAAGIVTPKKVAEGPRQGSDGPVFVSAKSEAGRQIVESVLKRDLMDEYEVICHHSSAEGRIVHRQRNDEKAESLCHVR